MKEELVRISESRYEELKRIGESIEQRVVDPQGNTDVPFFSDRRNYPTAEELEDAGAPQKIREWLPYFIYYLDVYQPDEDEMEEYEKTRGYIKNLLNEWLDIIPDEAFAGIQKITAGGWTKMDLEERSNRFSELIEYYSPMEFNEFVKDLGWRNFMASYKITERKNYAASEMLIDDLYEVWEKVQSRPIQA